MLSFQFQPVFFLGFKPLVLKRQKLAMFKPEIFPGLVCSSAKPGFKMAVMNLGKLLVWPNPNFFQVQNKPGIENP